MNSIWRSLLLLQICQRLQQGTCGSMDDHDVIKHSHDDARRRCEDVVLPYNQSTNDELLKYMAKNNLSIAWLNAEITQSYWHSVSDGMPLYDQGCYHFNDLLHNMETPALRFLSISPDNCTKLCLSLKKPFAALQHIATSSDIGCICVKELPTLERLPEGSCQSPCRAMTECGSSQSNTFRVLAATSAPDPSRVWGKEGRKGALCAASLVSDGHHVLTQSPCGEKMRFLCDIGKQPLDTKSQASWFESYNVCLQHGGHILTAGTGWTDIKAWKWTLNAYNTDRMWKEPISFTRWASDEPNFSRGSCISLAIDGFWRTNNCSTAHYSLCERGGTGNNDVAMEYIGTTPFIQEYHTFLPTTSAQSDHQSLIITAVTASGIIAGLIIAGLVVLLYRARASNEHHDVTSKASNEHHDVTSKASNEHHDVTSKNIALDSDNKAYATDAGIAPKPAFTRPVPDITNACDPTPEDPYEIPIDTSSDTYEVIPDDAVHDIQDMYLTVVEL